MIDLTIVYILYKKIVSIEEYYHPEKKWTHVLPDGVNLQEPKEYYKELNMQVPKEGGEIEFNTDVIERLVERCIKAGATIIQFKCTDEKNNYCYPDYKISELENA